MYGLKPRDLLKALAVNQVNALPFAPRLKDFIGSRHRGGNDWADRDIREHSAHVREIFEGIRKPLGSVEGKRGFELGPGDDVGVAYCFLKAGARSMVTMEPLMSVRLDRRMQELFETLDEELPDDTAVKTGDVLERRGQGFALAESKLDHRVARFEAVRFQEPFDFGYSNDVLEHVRDVGEVFAMARKLLAPGARFINNVDLAGHNMYRRPTRPLDFLMCPDWLWTALASHLVTTNRVRAGDLRAALRREGFVIFEEEVLVRASQAYLDELRPKLAEKYRGFPDHELGIVQIRLSATRS